MQLPEHVFVDILTLGLRAGSYYATFSSAHQVFGSNNKRKDHHNNNNNNNNNDISQYQHNTASVQAQDSGSTQQCVRAQWQPK